MNRGERIIGAKGMGMPARGPAGLRPIPAQGRREQDDGTSPASPSLPDSGPTSHFVPRLGRRRQTSPAGFAGLLWRAGRLCESLASVASQGPGTPEALPGLGPRQQPCIAETHLSRRPRPRRP